MKKPPTVKYLILCLCVILFNYSSFSQAAANTCAGALSINPGTGTCTNYTSTVASSTLDGVATTCQGTAKYDVWYKFTATANSATISLTGIGGNFTSPALQVLSGCGGTVIACGGTSIPVTLVSGTTYWLRIFSTTSGAIPTTNAAFTVCILNGPVNDNCADALTLTPAYTCTGASQLTGQTLQNAITSGVATACGNAASPDVWYQFTAVSTRPTITASSLGTSWGSGMRIQLLSRTGPCAGLAEINCVTNTPLTPTTDLIPGDVYYIRIHRNSTAAATGSNWGFSICVTDAPVNDHCANAITVTPTGKCNPTAGNLYGATQTNPAGSSCGNRYDVWYKFTLPTNPEATYASIGLTFTSSTSALTNGNTYIELFNANNCSVDNTSAGCTNLNNNNNPRSYTGLTPGGTYYFRINTSANTNNNPANWGFNVCVTTFEPFSVGTSGRMREVFQQTVLSPPGILADPWEITYGPDNYLWITEAKGYKLQHMNPSTGVKTTILDVSQNSTFLPLADQTFNCQFNNGSGAQGGFAGMALHPKFLDPVTPKNYVYVSYVHSQNATFTNIFINRIVRFTYNTSTGLLESPVSVCDTLPGSSDHNSQRMIIAPVGGTNYLFYAQGDMGAGQFVNKDRTNKAQMTNSYEGKILRFNLEPDGDGGTLDQWIPNDNPYNIALGEQSAVWSIGIRNNQGFVYDAVHDKLYGSSHGPYSDDEINIIEPARNYGHPLVIGYSWDDNVNGTTAGASPNMAQPHPSSCPVITDESDNAAAIGPSYKDPLFSAYPNSVAFPSITDLWNTTAGANAQWPSEGWSGLDLYTHTLIPGWKQSLVAASLKWGRLLKIRLNATGDVVIPTDGADTVSYFGSQNRFRDLAFSPNGKDMYVVMDRSTTSSGPSALNPVVPACPGCVQKYTFLGYADNAGTSTIPEAIDVTSGVSNFISNAGTSVTIDATNSNLWVPITGPDGNIMAEIYANGQNLGTITSSFYQNAGPIRVNGSIHYLDRSMTINPAIAPTGPVKVRLYISKAEYDALDADVTSPLSNPNQLRIYKNSDPNGSVMTAATTSFLPHTIALHGTNGYVLQSDTISSFSTFYFAAAPAILPLDLITFTGTLQNDNTVLLKWKTENEINTSHFVIERSIDGSHFSAIGTVSARGNGTNETDYSFTDIDAANQSSSKLYYRLMMVDIDAVYSYSDIVTITIPFVSGKVTVYPNPFAAGLKVSVSTLKEGTVQWKLIDNNGRTVLQNSEKVRRGNNLISINVNKLSTGFYYLTVSGAGIDQKIKLQKLSQ